MERQTFWVDFSRYRERDEEYRGHPIPTTPEKGNLTSSALVDEERRRLEPTDDGIFFAPFAPTFGQTLHAPALDLDVPARLVPSSTPGRSHLYIDKPMTWGEYTRLLTVLGDVGILEGGWVSASLRQGATFLRREGLIKGVNDELPHPLSDALLARTGDLSGVELEG